MLRFTLRRDRYGRLSACADGPSGRDVDCRVHVRVRLMPTGRASEARLALTVLRRAVPADAAGLRRVRRIDFLNASRCLLLQTTDQCTPAVGQDASVESGLRTATVRQVSAWSFGDRFGLGTSAHRCDAQVFHPDDIEPPCEVCAGLLHPILTASTCPGMQFCDRGSHPLAAVGVAPAARETTLQALEPRPLTIRQTGAGQQFTGGQGRRHRDAAVHTDDRTRSGRWNWFRDDREGDVPATCRVQGDPVRLRCRDALGQAHAHPADLGYVDRGPLPAQLHDPGRLTTDDTKAFVLPGLAPGWPLMSSREEVPDRLVEISQRLLLHRLRSGPQPVERGPGFGQLSRLLDVPRSSAFVAGPHRPLLQCEIPQVPCVPALHQQRSLLCGSRVHPKPAHAANPISPDRHSPSSEGRKSRFFLSNLKDSLSPRPVR